MMIYDKSKSKTSATTELHFLSSVQLEEAVHVIGTIADGKHQVTLTEISPNEFKFHIDYLPNSSKEAEIKGTLQRWNGTETKIDADGDVFRIDIPDSSQSGVSAVASAAMMAFIGSGVALASGQLWLIMPVIMGALGLGYYGLSYSDNDKATSRVFFRNRDYLLQRLIDAFKAAGEVEAI